MRVPIHQPPTVKLTKSQRSALEQGSVIQCHANTMKWLKARGYVGEWWYAGGSPYSTRAEGRPFAQRTEAGRAVLVG